MSIKKFYITTPIYYVNDVPHLGHAYCTIAADVLARWQRLQGKEVYFLTGTDEHGQKIEKQAQANNETPIQLADRVVIRFKELWQKLNISNDDFIRTTEERHKKTVQYIFKKIYDHGDIYLGFYEDWYCHHCESYYTETQLTNNNCPLCQRAVSKLKEESYFFKLSKYEKALLEYIEKNPDFVQPVSRRNEVISFINQGLTDLSISRTTINWGIDVPDIPSQKTEKKHYIYVWFDALINYISAPGYPENINQFNSTWPADVHLIGKDIIKFHAIIWPAMLMSAGIVPPKQVFAHGFINMGGEKMSKSKGNVVNPSDIINDFGADVLRYFLLREFVFGQDGTFFDDALLKRYNADLANDYGNLLNRTLTMAEKYFEGKSPDFKDIPINKLSESSLKTISDVGNLLNNLKFSQALEAIWKLISLANAFIEETAPWVLSKENKLDELKDVIYSLLETIRIATILISPIMPDISQTAWGQLGFSDKIESHGKNGLKWGLFPKGKSLKKGQPLFPRR